MGKVQQIDDETMYAAWVASGRNGNVAARQLGIPPGSLRHHVRTKKFEERYAGEQEGTATIQRRLATYTAMGRLSKVYDRLYAIAMGTVEQVIGVTKDGEPIIGPPSFRDQVTAAQTIFRSLPPMIVETPEDQHRRMLPSLTLVDARQIHGSMPMGRVVPAVEGNETMYQLEGGEHQYAPFEDSNTQDSYAMATIVSPDETLDDDALEAQARSILSQRMAQG